MNAKQIADALRLKPSSTECMNLIRACDQRRQWLRAREAQINGRSNGAIQDPPERAAAVLAGPDAIEQLDNEIKELRTEWQYLQTLERACYEAHESTLDLEMQRAIPSAKKQLPRALERLQTVIESLDAAIMEIKGLVGAIGEFQRLPDKRFPLSDGELARLIELRAAVWTTRHVAVLQPPNPDDYPQCWRLFYDQRPDGTHRVRRPGPWLPDLVTSDNLLSGRQ